MRRARDETPWVVGIRPSNNQGGPPGLTHLGLCPLGLPWPELSLEGLSLEGLGQVLPELNILDGVLLPRNAREFAQLVLDALPSSSTGCHMVALALRDGASTAPVQTHRKVLEAMAELCEAVVDLRTQALMEADTEPDTVIVEPGMLKSDR